MQEWRARRLKQYGFNFLHKYQTTGGQAGGKSDERDTGQFKPYAYQEKSIKWILDHERCGLLLDMGLGKVSVH